MAKNIDDKFTFGILRKERSKYGAAGITMDNLPDGYIDRFNEATIDRAKILKSKHKDKYSDECYLKMAKQLEIRDMLGSLLQVQEKATLHYELKNTKWAQFSYEEIIQMEEDGVNIPKDVLEWAHAQQQADETNYVILTEEVENDDNGVTDEAEATNDLNGLRLRSMKDIVKVEKAEEETNKTLNYYNEKAEGARQIQIQKEEKFKQELDEIKKLTEEWKTLNDKQKNGGKLTNDEQKRLEKLGKLLNGSDGKFLKEIQADNLELDNFLDSLNTISNQLEKNTKIAQDTIQNATQLSSFELQHTSDNLPFAKASFNSEKGLTTETLNGIKENEIPSLAMEKGKDFEQYNNNILNEIGSDTNVKLAHFATDYTTLATKAENNTKEAMGEEFEKSGGNEEEKEQSQDTYQIDNMSFTFANALKATIVTANATANVLENQNQTENLYKNLTKDNKKSLKDIIKLNSETKKSESKHNDYMSEEEAFLAELESTKAKNLQTTTEPLENTADSTQEIIDEIKATDDKDKNVQDGVKKALSASVVSTSNSESTSKELTKDTNALSKTNSNVMQVAEQTALIGSGTFAKNFITMQIGQALIKAGIALIPQPPTHAQGVALTYAGNMNIVQGYLEQASGVGATNAAEAGFAASNSVGEFDDMVQDSLKNTNAETKANKKTFQQTQKVLETEEGVNIDKNSASDNSQNTAETESSIENPVKNTSALQISDKEQQETPPVTSEDESNKTKNQLKQVETTESNTQNSDKNEEVKTDENNQNSNNQINTETVPNEFTVASSVAATAMTINAISDLANNQGETEKYGEELNSEAKVIEKYVNNLYKQTSDATKKHNANLVESENIIQQVGLAQEKALVAENSDEIEKSQIITEELNNQFMKVQEQDSTASKYAKATINNGTQQLSKLQKNTTKFGKNINAFNSKISNQLEITKAAMDTGAGTILVGATHIVEGQALVTAGAALLTNIVTEPQGAAMISAGQNITTKGISEAAAGGVAFATGTVGVATNNVAQTVLSANSAIEKSVASQNKNTDKIIKNSAKSLKEFGEEKEKFPENKVEDNSNKNSEEEIIIEESILEETDKDENLLAASASTNVSITASSETDDKTDKRLTRFNEESIIESRKKKKKVVAVSASSRNRR